MSESSSRHPQTSSNYKTRSAGTNAKTLGPLAVSPTAGAAIRVGRTKFYELQNKNEIPALKLGAELSSASLTLKTTSTPLPWGRASMSKHDRKTGNVMRSPSGETTARYRISGTS